MKSLLPLFVLFLWTHSRLQRDILRCSIAHQEMKHNCRVGRSVVVNWLVAGAPTKRWSVGPIDPITSTKRKIIIPVGHQSSIHRKQQRDDGNTQCSATRIYESKQLHLSLNFILKNTPEEGKEGATDDYSKSTDTWPSHLLQFFPSLGQSKAANKKVNCDVQGGRHSKRIWYEDAPLGDWESSESSQ